MFNTYLKSTGREYTTTVALLARSCFSRPSNAAG